MTSIAQIQQQLQRYLLHDDRQIERQVTGTTRVPVEVRLGIYRDAYRARLVEALASNFPVLAQLLGEQEFAALGAAYVRAQPSRWFSIRHYGNVLADFMAGQAEYRAAPLLAELARWEWTMGEVFDAADATPIDVQQLANVAPAGWAGLCFEVHPSARRVDLCWNAPATWQAVTDGEERSQPSCHSPAVPWLLWRAGLRIFFRSLPAIEAVAFDRALAGRSFGEICLELADSMSEEEAPAAAASMLRGWVEAGLLVALR